MPGSNTDVFELENDGADDNNTESRNMNYRNFTFALDNISIRCLYYL